MGILHKEMVLKNFITVNKVLYCLFSILAGLWYSDLFAQVTQPYILENKDIKVSLDPERPAVMEYVLKSNNATLYGNLNHSSPGISFYYGANPVYRLKTKITYTPSYDQTKLIYHTGVVYDNKPAIDFDLIYQVKDNTLIVSLKNVVEHKGFYLFNVNLPGLVSVQSEGGKLVIPANSGRLIDVASASLKTYDYEIDWLNPILAAFAYHPKIIAVLDTKSIENHTSVAVSERGEQKFGSLSMNFIYRLKQYDLAEFGTVISANDPQFYLKVQDSCSAIISLAGDYDQDGNVNWIDGAKMLRDKVQATPNPYYRDKTFVRTFLARKGGDAENLPFNKVLDRIKEFAFQTDSAAYVMYLLGWQYSGHDSGYPSVDSVNKQLGGYTELLKLITEARKYHVNVTFYDNYDDSYSTHPGWDPEVICRDPLNNLMKGGAWDGEQSYLISSYKYALKSGLNRIRFTLKKYPVRDAYFIDVLAGGYNGGRKYDFNPLSPAGAEKNFTGKKLIIEEFNNHGLDVATEDFTGYFVGHVGTFGDIIAFDDIYFKGEEQIPLIPFIYHGKTSFGMKTSSASQYVRTFLYGQRAQKFTNSRITFSPADYILDALPKQKLYGKSMKSYEKNGDDEKVVYEDGTSVEINTKENSYTVTLGNKEVIARNYTSFVPMEQNTYLACSKAGGLLSHVAPKQWTDKERIKVFELNKDGSKTNVSFRLENGNLEFNSRPNVSYKIVYQ